MTGNNTWSHANITCREDGGVLASIPDTRTNQHLLSLIAAGHRAFVGGFQENGKWNWSDGSEFVNFSSSNWDFGTFLSISNNNARTEVHGFICQQPPKGNDVFLKLFLSKFTHDRHCL